MVIEVSDKLRIINSDCLDELRRWEAEVADVVVTSPPYNIRKAYHQYDDSKTPQEYLHWLHNIAIEIKRILKPDGSFFLNVGSVPKDPLKAEQICESLLDLFVLQNSICWVKNISIGDTSYGHFKPGNSPRFLNNCWERIFHLTKCGDLVIDRLAIGVPYTDKYNAKRWKSRRTDRRCAGNCWFISYQTVGTPAKYKKNHPAGFPVELPHRCILLHGLREGMHVVDPFMGAGTTLKACKALNIKGTGIEIDETYCRVAVESLNE